MVVPLYFYSYVQTIDDTQEMTFIITFTDSRSLLDVNVLQMEQTEN